MAKGRQDVRIMRGYLVDLSTVVRLPQYVLCDENQPLLTNRPSRPIPFLQGERYEAVCNGCPAPDAYDGITMGVENLVPTCTETLENTRSDGANTSIEDIRIDPGYWRATTTTKTILACYNADACLGGITGEAGYCRKGYYGPCKILLETFFVRRAP